MDTFKIKSLMKFHHTAKLTETDSKGPTFTSICRVNAGKVEERHVILIGVICGVDK